MAERPSNASLSCSLCGRGGLLYMAEGKPFCPACMKKAHPPLPYDGPERRSRQASTPWRRRLSDKKGATTR